MIQKQIHQLEEDLLLNQDKKVKEVNKNQAFLLSQRLEIAAVTMDYVRACLASINEVKEIVEKKIFLPQYKNLKGELQRMKDVAQQLQLNLGALLYHRYKYTRGGGIVDRVTASATSKRLKKKLWGNADLPPPNYQSYTAQIQEFKENEKREEIKKFLEMFAHYTHTQELLSRNEDILLQKQEQKNLDYYQKSISEIFDRPLKLTPLNLYSETFQIGTYKREESLLGTSSPNGE